MDKNITLKEIFLTEHYSILLNSNIDENESHGTVLNGNVAFNNVEDISECLINNDI